MSDEGAKIIIDEGWKQQVQREKELAATKPVDEPVNEAALAPEAYEANFATLIASLATQAMMALGVIAPPDAQEVMIHLEQALFSIDTLEMLTVKTAGNLTEEETLQLTETIAELQRIYMVRVQQLQEQELRQSGVDPMGLNLK